MSMTAEPIGTVLESNPGTIIVEISSQDKFENAKTLLQIGSFLKIECGNNYHLIASVKSLKSVNKAKENQEPALYFVIIAQPLGSINQDSEFFKGTLELPVPTEPVYLADEGILNEIFQKKEGYNFPLGSLLQNKDIALNVNGDKLFSKHLAVLGTTGSGKSCAVSRIIQNVVGVENCENFHREKQRNSHVIIFDVHSEYKNAFSLEKDQQFNLNYLDFSNLAIPYWLMNAEELEAMFIESNESNSHNQVSQFRYAVLENKKWHNPGKKITYDTPVFFSLDEVCNYIENMNKEMIYKGTGDTSNYGKPKLEDGTYISQRSDYFHGVLTFSPESRAAADKCNSGPFNGEFNRFVLRLRTKLADERLKFMLNPQKSGGGQYSTQDFPEILKQFLGYLNKSNISIIDLSGVPFEVLSISVSLVSRIIFDFFFHYSKIKHQSNELNDVPVLIVCEEAHNYIPNSSLAMYSSSKKSIERIAKEGRKYGVSLMVVSQRPSEVSETVLAQCNNFISMRLSNSNDQAFVKKLMPDTTNGVADILPELGDGEFVVVGDSTVMPSIGKFKLPSPEPNSKSVKYLTEWQKDWIEPSFEGVVGRMVQSLDNN